MKQPKREPIIGIRKPITGLRKPILLSEIMDPEMTWDIQYSKLNNYIKYVAGQVASSLPSAMMSSEDLYQEGLILLYNCFEKYKLKNEKEFHALFKSSCWRLLRGFCYKKKEFSTVDLDEVFDIGYDNNQISKIYEEYRIQQVIDMLKCNTYALQIFKELLYPSQRTLWEVNMDMARKETLKSQGHRVSVPSELVVKPSLLKRIMNLPKSEFDSALKLVQSTVYSIYSQDTEIKSYSESDYLTDEEFSSKYEELQSLIKRLSA